MIGRLLIIMILGFILFEVKLITEEVKNKEFSVTIDCQDFNWRIK